MKIAQKLVGTKNRGCDKKKYWGQIKNVAIRDKMLR